MKDFAKVLVDVDVKCMVNYSGLWKSRDIDKLTQELLDQVEEFAHTPDDDPEAYNTLCHVILQGLMVAERIRPKCDYVACDHGMGFGGGGGCPGEPTDAECSEFTREYSEGR